MSIDTVTPRSRRAILAGAFGGLLASVAAFAKAPGVHAAPGDPLLLEVVNTTAGTTDVADSSAGPALRVKSDAAVGVLGSSGVSSIPPPIDTSTGVYGISLAGVGVYGASDTGPGIYAANNASTVAAIVAEGDPGTAIHGHAGAGPVGASPAATGIYGSAAASGIAIAASSASGLAVKATSSLGHGMRGRGALDGTIGESTGGRSGVVGYSGAGGAAPAGPAKTGVYGEATQDTNSRGVSGFSLAGQGVRGEATTGQGVAGIATSSQAVRGDATTGQGVAGFSGAGMAPPAKTGVYGEANHDADARGVVGRTTVGQGVRGQASSGIGVRAVSATGIALDATGKVRLNRSGIAQVPANRDYVDVTVPGGIGTTAMVFATVQLKRNGASVLAARPGYPSAGLLRIYLNKVASTTVTTPVAWWVLL
jgi:hypothetical protein